MPDPATAVDAALMEFVVPIIGLLLTIIGILSAFAFKAMWQDQKSGDQILDKKIDDLAKHLTEQIERLQKVGDDRHHRLRREISDLYHIKTWMPQALEKDPTEEEYIKAVKDLTRMLQLKTEELGKDE